jgi:uroporphyrinogen decarboxylase
MSEDLSAVAPDWEGMMRNMRREGTPDRVYYFEHGVAENIQRALDDRFGICDHLRDSDPHYEHRRREAVHRFLGHELFRVFPPGARISVPRGEGGWAEEHCGAAGTWEGFESFPWPRPADADLSVLEFFEHNLPADMRVFHVIDVWEVVRDLVGFETFCYKAYDDPALVEAVFEKVGGFAVGIVEALCDFACVGAVYLADDLGYKTGLMLSPELIRRHLMPWHRRITELAHRHEKLLLFHCCGDMYELLDEYIDGIRIDAKHSFEQNVLPVTEANRCYGERLTLLGGVDVDLLARGDEETIRSTTRRILDECMSGGGYFLGSGKWVTDYVPVRNYIWMLQEARRWAK